MIIITDNKELITPGAWDFPLDEIDYLLEEHNNEMFVLNNGRLFEVGTYDQRGDTQC